MYHLLRLFLANLETFETCSYMHVTCTCTSIQCDNMVSSPGQASGNIVLEILADDIPEREERLTLTLTGVEPSATQRLSSGASEREIVIQENDSPGGVFHFSPDTRLAYVIQVGNNK